MDECVRESCDEDMDCDIDSEITSCEKECEVSDSCVEKCMGGGDWWKEFEEEHKIENAVFNLQGSCRKIESREEGNIWFGGWGDPFEEVQDIKEK